MLHKTIPLFVFTVVFVIASACGDDSKSNKDLEIEALMRANAQKASQGAGTVTLTNTSTVTNSVTSTLITTVTQVGTSSGSTGSSTSTRE